MNLRKFYRDFYEISQFGPHQGLHAFLYSIG